MIIEIDDVEALLQAVRRGRSQLVTRQVQLANCRACGADLQEVVRAIETLRKLENQLKGEPT